MTSPESKEVPMRLSISTADLSLTLRRRLDKLENGKGLS